MNLKKSLLLALVFINFASFSQEQKDNDIVFKNTRVIDPETNTDGLLNVGIIGDKIAEVSKTSLTDKKIIDGTGKILSPGFIDLHAHGQTNKENEYQAFDGVTTALELEVGVDTLTGYYQARKGNSLLNFGASACHLAYRNKTIANNDRVYTNVYEELQDSRAQQVLTEDKFPLLRKKLVNALNNGAIGMGIPVGYLTNTSVEEIADVYAFAYEEKAPIFSHVREGGSIAFQQVISDAVLNQTQLHICHLPSMARKDVDFCLNEVEKAQALGFPITTELYPYTAGNTEIGSAIFNEGWQERLNCTYKDLQWVETNERLTPETFEKYRKQGGSVIVHMMKEEWLEKVITSNVSMIASDGGAYSPTGHPRGSGTFSKVIRKYVNEENLISINTAIIKMSLMPAKVLESVVPEMKLRGRMQKGCYADLLLFNLEDVKDNATFNAGFVKSTGMDHVIINGTILIENGELQPNTFPGKGIKGAIKI